MILDDSCITYIVIHTQGHSYFGIKIANRFITVRADKHASTFKCIQIVHIRQTGARRIHRQVDTLPLVSIHGDVRDQDSHGSHASTPAILRENVSYVEQPTAKLLRKIDFWKP